MSKQHTPLFEKSKPAIIKDLKKNEEIKKNKQIVDVSLQGAVLINQNFDVFHTFVTSPTFYKSLICLIINKK